MAAIQKPFGSMRRRCQAVIASRHSRGSHTSYRQLLLLVIELFGTFFWSNILKPQFWGVWGKPQFLGSASLTTERMLPIVHIWYITMKLMKKTCPQINAGFSFCISHAVKCNTNLNTDP